MELFIEVLEKSTFDKLNGGKVFFRQKGNETILEIPTKNVSETDLLLPGYVKYLNPVQTVFQLFHENHDSILVSTPTSSGKTITAIIKIQQALKEGKKVIYTAPIKALTYQVYMELVEIFGSSYVERRDGDNFINNYLDIRPSTKIIVTTNEFLSISIRNKADWLRSIGLVIIDEVHSIYDKLSVDEIITFAKLGGKKILALSATIPNIDELKNYIGATFVIESKYRPVPLYRKVENIVHSTKYQNELLAILRDQLLEGKKAILFTTKNIMWKILEKAYLSGEFEIVNQTVPFDIEEKNTGRFKIAVHNAAVPMDERKEIERLFKLEGEDGLNAILATTTLAYGVNLPTDTVIIYVMRNGGKFFPKQIDILQMEGRAGRFGIREKGESIIVPMNIKKEDLEKFLLQEI